MGHSGVPWGLLGLLGACRGLLLWPIGFLGFRGASWGFLGFRAGSRRVSWCFLRHPGVVWSLWLALVSSSCGFWRVLASSCRLFGGCLRPVVVAWAGRSCPVGFWTGFLEAGLVEACLLEGVFVEAVFGVFLGRGLMGASWGFLGVFWGLYPGASWSLWLALVSSSCGFWRVLASSCRLFGGCLRPVVVAWAGRSCPVGFWTGFLEAGLVEACLLEGVFVEAVFGVFLGRGLMGASWGFLGVFWGLYPGASWSLWLALVSSSCGFWRVLAPSCRPFGGCLRPVVVAWAGARVRSSF